MYRLYNRFLSLFFYLLYHSFSNFYSWVAYAVSFGRWNDWVYSILPLVGPGKILELGIGPGFLQEKLLENSTQIYGLDESRSMLKLASKKLKKGNHIPLIFQSPAQVLPLKSQSIAAIVSTFPTPYIFDPQTLSEANRVLGPEGQFIVLFGVEIHSSTFPEKILAWIYKITGESAQDIRWKETVQKKMENNGFWGEWITIEKPPATLYIYSSRKRGKSTNLM